MKLLILTSAIRDIQSGMDFYERQSPGLSSHFQKCLFSDIDSLQICAGIHRKMFGYFRLLSKRFPYAIYYRMDDAQTAVIYRVLDCRRDPKKIQQSLKP